ncbi:hypothetical protein [Treponema sp.]|uniref:hypothetical protein n=1 Tax=Treponema sp. TaxID=166 RepID=UPI0025D7ADEB|nr:hypothetical protein [Treponema sp.]MCR5218474.1 hypothetical protein [Treponema sp.]
MKKLFFYGAVLFAAVSFFSCRSLQRDIIMSTDSQVQTEDVLRIEKKLAKVDCNSICNLSDAKTLQADCNYILSDIQESIEKAGMNKALLARLYALEGRTYLIAGKRSKAEDYYELSRDSCKGDSQTIILGVRLGEIKNLNSEDLVAGSNENGLLILERGVQAYLNKSFSESVVYFDKAFMMLPDHYAENYGLIKSSAWELRAVEDVTDDKKIKELLLKNQVTLSEMLLITQETTDLLDEYTGGETLSEKKLYKILKNKGIFTAASDMNLSEKDQSVIERDQVMTKILCARILWNLYAARQGEGFVMSKYSQFYIENSFDSPITDVPADNKDFDAVLGCVENEVMDLEDGSNFDPDLKPSGVQVNKWAQKVK